MPTDKWGWRGMRITVEHSFSTIRVYTGVQAGDHRGNWRDEYQITVCAYFIYTHLSFHEYIGSSKLVSYRHMPLQKSQPIAKSWSHAHSFYMRSLQVGPGKYLLGRLGTEDLTRPHWIYPRDTDLSKENGGGVGEVQNSGE